MRTVPLPIKIVVSKHAVDRFIMRVRLTMLGGEALVLLQERAKNAIHTKITTDRGQRLWRIDDPICYLVIQAETEKSFVVVTVLSQSMISGMAVYETEPGDFQELNQMKTQQKAGAFASIGDLVAARDLKLVKEEPVAETAKVEPKTKAVAATPKLDMTLLRESHAALEAMIAKYGWYGEENLAARQVCDKIGAALGKKRRA